MKILSLQAQYFHAAEFTIWLDDSVDTYSLLAQGDIFSYTCNGSLVNNSAFPERLLGVSQWLQAN